jgi:hypothetical protein
VVSGADSDDADAASSGACDWAQPGDAPISAAKTSIATAVPIPTVRTDIMRMVS